MENSVTVIQEKRISNLASNREAVSFPLPRPLPLPLPLPLPPPLPPPLPLSPERVCLLHLKVEFKFTSRGSYTF